MISELSIQNYQSHKKSILNFTLGVNSIVGSSNCGKTAILRSLYWAIYNRPGGISYISHWNRDKNDKPIKSTFVRVTNDNNVIERRKGKVKVNDESKDFNGYIVNGKYLEAIGQDVPDEVTKLFNLDSVNIQRQMDAPFLLSESAGEVARFFNSTIRLDLIDRVLSKAESKRREANKEKIRLDNENIELLKEIGTFNWLDDAEVLADKIEKIENRVNDNENNLRVIENSIKYYNESLAIIECHEVVLSAVPIVNKIVSVQELLEQNIERCERLQNLSEQWEEQNTIIEGTADFSKALLMIENIDDFRKEIYEKVQLLEKLEETIEDWNIKYMEKDLLATQILDYEKQLPKLCPICEKPLNNFE
jgi:DNA repair protein SbcC/Rad50